LIELLHELGSELSAEWIAESGFSIGANWIAELLALLPF
jgi:hypothetical protein